MSMEIVTTGLGAGTYPEPPPMQEYEAPACDECGWDDNKLIETDGRMLCPGCRAEYIFANASVKDFEAYIKENYDAQKAFYLGYYWPDEEEIKRFTYAKRAFLDLDPDVKEEMLKNYTKENLSDFIDFTDKLQRQQRKIS